ncbi:uncharacterized protein F5891DRAFT_1206737 [Suillus fuscotomentosus]|uniref:Uncharacterized protein n=1 Tax=Suillus fuscotomentosus TaxID=1912939 RepID=A0AAD4HV07_9AGAM|nr:uncharacterized protein F5891DRAFT_1206737 [Suillus fuscotomentosus]KAG1908936.1 hypothetical protein F5891DRAFT_1206737 [Suillus fuscotomentosus]
MIASPSQSIERKIETRSTRLHKDRDNGKDKGKKGSILTGKKSRKAEFLANNGEGWTMVIGNEAGDLDSLASALGYAWLRPNMSGKAITYITTPREDFVLRAENLHALGLAGINHPFEELYCPGDPIPSQVSQFALVDHNPGLF